MPSWRSVNNKSGATCRRCRPKRCELEHPLAHAPILGDESTKTKLCCKPATRAHLRSEPTHKSANRARLPRHDVLMTPYRILEQRLPAEGIAQLRRPRIRLRCSVRRRRGVRAVPRGVLFPGVPLLYPSAWPLAPDLTYQRLLANARQPRRKSASWHLSRTSACPLVPADQPT